MPLGGLTGTIVSLPNKKKENKMNTTRIKMAFIAILLAFAALAPAAYVTLPTPPESSFPDSESSRVVPIQGWSDDGRRADLTFTATVTSSNNVQVAFGKDLNGDEDLEPEEVQIVVGFDGGVWFARDERTVARPSLVAEDWTDADVTPTNVTRTIRLKQALAVSNRFDLAKVTVRGRGETAAEIVAEVYRRGSVITLQ